MPACSRSIWAVPDLRWAKYTPHKPAWSQPNYCSCPCMLSMIIVKRNPDTKSSRTATNSAIIPLFFQQVHPCIQLEKHLVRSRPGIPRLCIFRTSKYRYSLHSFLQQNHAIYGTEGKIPSNQKILQCRVGNIEVPRRIAGIHLHLPGWTSSPVDLRRKCSMLVSRHNQETSCAELLCPDQLTHFSLVKLSQYHM